MAKRKFSLGWILLVLLSLLPIIPLLMNSPSLTNYTNFTHALGQIAALVGMNLFALSFVLSARFKFIEDVFGGLDKVYRVHSVVGAFALVLLLFHPILLVLKFIPSNLKLAAVYLLPGSIWSVNFGIIALLGMVLLLVITLYIKMQYNHWKFSHEFFGLFFIIAVFHIFLVRGTASRDDIFPGYYIYVIIVAFIGLIGFIYSLLLRKKLMSAGYSVESITNKEGCYDISLIPISKPKTYYAGQFMFLRFYSKNITREPHPFSIASSSNNERMRFIIKVLGDFTSELDKVQVGDRVGVEGPYGRFNKHSFSDQVWIAGGIGVTPFLGMAQDLKKSTFKVDLYYSVAASTEFISLDELKDVAKINKNFRVIEWVSAEKGWLTIDAIKKQSGSLYSKEFYICGPNSMKSSLKTALINEMVSKENIFEEDFNFK